ncbi:hypothetical protein Q4Q35_12305 [Flavivirga aquimarina]|uniref:Rapsyn myristoylation/linker region N-terminal domain-containing protein n=1 Tax=Flavivirga aquimarina TaxID=2027862 RepID=A0ABT8WBU4_9FLAO|nr:hypothetical protein [Flavivirga aquimarina]MDO5970590.1 hypothetical protein [Flavivirga aquimarina]
MFLTNLDLANVTNHRQTLPPIMKKILLILIILVSNQSFCQTELDKEIDKGIELYQDGKKDKALKVWKKIEKKSKNPSSTYGTTLGNILYYYVGKDDEKNILEYYQKIINSDLNDKDKNHEIGNPYKNYRYHATMRLASYYGKKGEFEKGLTYIEKADNEITFETTSLTSFIYQKVDLAFWKYRFLNDLGQKDKAISKLIERAFEYDYKEMHSNWATASVSNDENELSETICSEFNDLKKLKSDIDSGIENLTFDKVNKVIGLKINGMDYEINLYSELSDEEKCKLYLENSFFYKYLTKKIKD